MLNRIKNKNLYLIGLSTVLIIAQSTFTLHLSSRLAGINAIKDGINTCFSRVKQSYTAKLMGEGTNFLSEEYLTTTQECFADAKLLLDTKYSRQFGDISKLATSLSSKVNWLHKALEMNGVRGSDTNLFDSINGKYEKVDAISLQIDEGLSNQVVEVEQMLTKQKIALGFFGLFFALVFGVEVSNRNRKQRLSDFLEIKAMDFIKNQDTGDAACALIEDALLQNNLENCSNLFSNIQNETQKIDTSKEFEIVCELEPELNIECTLEEDLAIELELEEDLIEEESVWCSHLVDDLEPNIIEDSRGSIIPKEVPKPQHTPKYGTDIDKTIDSVLDLVEQKLVANRVMIDIVGEEGVLFDIPEESCLHIINSIILKAIDRLAIIDGSRKISISITSENDRVQVNFVDNGSELTPHEIEYIISNDLAREHSAICEFTSKESSQEVSLIAYRGVEKVSRPELSFYKKTTKREFLAQL